MHTQGTTNNADRLGIQKTYKLFIGGKFPRTESGRSTKHDGPLGVTHLCHASRKDLRNAVEAAEKARSGWANATAYLRGQILYRVAEMLEARAGEFGDAIGEGGREQCAAAADRFVAFAGWTDKLAQVLGSANQVAGPYYNFTVPGPVGVTFIAAPDEQPLLGLTALLAPVLAGGNTAVVLASETNPVPSMIFAEVLATSDVPGGVVNILTGFRDELFQHVANHRGIGCIVASGASEAQAAVLRAGAAENLKRVSVLDAADVLGDGPAAVGPFAIERSLEMKTVWHPSAT